MFAVSFAANSVSALSVAVADTDPNGDGVNVMLLSDTDYTNFLGGNPYSGKRAPTQRAEHTGTILDSHNIDLHARRLRGLL